MPSPMRLVVDAVCSEFGGNRTYVDHLLRRWRELRPADELHVMVPRDSTLPTHGHVRHEIGVPRPSVLSRPLVQTRELRRLTRSVNPDAVLATAPPTTLRRLGAPLVVVVLDLRHELLPEQFTRGRRLLRRVAYGRSFRIADGFLTISARTLGDLHQLHPATAQRPGVVTHLGGDHALDWPEPTREGPAIAFGHHTNKNPELVIRAWARAIERGIAVPPLTVVGASAGLRAHLESVLAQEGLESRVQLAPFLDDASFTALMASASMIVFPSDFEGFGLPIVEGMWLRKPVVISPEPGSTEVAGGHAAVMRGWSPDDLADAIEEALDLDEAALEKAAAWAEDFSWSATVERTAESLERLVRR